MDVATRRTDSQLIADARRQPEHFATVFDRHYAKIFAYAARRLGRDLAEDVASETFLIAFSRIDGYDTGRVDAAPWLYGIASNLIARHGRSEKRRYTAMAKVPPEVPAAEIDVASALDAKKKLAVALAKLPGPERDVLLLVAWAGLSQPEVATALGVPAGTVRSRLHRARQEMRAALNEGDVG